MNPKQKQGLAIALFAIAALLVIAAPQQFSATGEIFVAQTKTTLNSLTQQLQNLLKSLGGSPGAATLPPSQPLAPQDPATLQLARDAQSLTTQLLQANTQYKNAQAQGTDSQKSSSLNSLKAIVAQRKQKMLALAEKDQQAFLNIAQQQNLKSQLPQELAPEVEFPASVSSRVAELVVDYSETAQYLYFVEDSNGDLL